MDFDDDDENSKDWWTKYFWSYEKLIDDAKEQKFRITGGGNNNVPNGKDDKSKLGVKGSKLVARLSPKHRRKVERSKSSTALCQVLRVFLLLFVLKKRIFFLWR